MQQQTPAANNKCAGPSKGASHAKACSLTKRGRPLFEALGLEASKGLFGPHSTRTIEAVDGAFRVGNQGKKKMMTRREQWW